MTDQSDYVKNLARQLVNEGRLEVTGIIDQFTLGLRYISDKLGKCGAPRVGWQIRSVTVANKLHSSLKWAWEMLILPGLIIEKKINVKPWTFCGEEVSL